MVHGWIGTSFFCARCARSSHPRRSSTQLLNLAARPGPSDALEDNLLSAGDDFQRRERSRRRTRDVLALEVVRAVVARAPDVRALRPVLNRAVEVRALGRQRPELPGRRPEEEHGLSTERDDASRVGSDVGGLHVQLELGKRRLGGFRRHQVAQDGVEKGECHGDEARPQKVGDPSPARRPRLARCYVQGSLTVFCAIVFSAKGATRDASASMIWWDQTYHDSSGSRSLCWMAKTRAPSLLWTLSFSRMCWRWLRAVVAEIASLLPIAAVVMPPARQCRISISRFVSGTESSRPLAIGQSGSRISASCSSWRSSRDTFFLSRRTWTRVERAG